MDSGDTGDTSDPRPEPGDPIVSLTVQEVAGVDRVGEYALSSIPLPASLDLRDPSLLGVFDADGEWLPSQVVALSRWNGAPEDGSLPIQWAAVGVVIDVAANQSETLTLRLRERPAQPRISLVNDEIDTGAQTFSLDPAQPGLLAGMMPMMVTGSGARLDADEITLASTALNVIEQGPARIVVSQAGTFEGGAETRCDAAGGYQPFTYLLTLSFVAGSDDVDIDYTFHNTCGDAAGGPWTDEAVTVNYAGVEYAPGMDDPTALYGGVGAVGLASNGVRVDQTHGIGIADLRSRLARVTIDGIEFETAASFDAPIVGLTTAGRSALISMPWMRYREPQALWAVGTTATMGMGVISERLVMAEASAVWGRGRISNTVAGQEDVARRQARAAMENGLLISADKDWINGSAVFPSLGTDEVSPIKDTYRAALETLHAGTVDPGGQWDRARQYGAQLWPDTRSDRDVIDFDSPAVNPGAMNYWNPANAAWMEYLRTGEPNWVWQMALPASQLQLHTAYYNIGDRSHGSRNGVAVTSGGTGEGQWHRSGFGSDDYTYNRDQYIAYVVRPDPARLARFAQAGQMVAARYAIPKADEATRTPAFSQRAITRQVIQHMEMLTNCAQFVPGSEGDVCRERLDEVVAEYLADNLSAGVMCADDVPTRTCRTPQQFMQSAMMFGFFMRLARTFPGKYGALSARLVEIGKTYAEWGLSRDAAGDIDPNAGFATGFSCELNPERDAIVNCDIIPDSDGNRSVYNPTKAHSLGMILQAHELDPRIGLCAPVRDALNAAAVRDGLNEWVTPNGFWKGANQSLQDLIFAVGVADTCD